MSFAQPPLLAQLVDGIVSKSPSSARNRSFDHPAPGRAACSGETTRIRVHTMTNLGWRDAAGASAYVPGQ